MTTVEEQLSATQKWALHIDYELREVPHLAGARFSVFAVPENSVVLYGVTLHEAAKFLSSRPDSTAEEIAELFPERAADARAAAAEFMRVWSKVENA